MKNLLLCFSFVAVNYSTLSQVSFFITEPAAIAGGYEFTSNGDAPNWGLANLNDPADAVLDTVVIVDDGTPGLNAQGIPFANEACDTIQNDVAGKIAFIYRYDGVSTNDCYAGTKVLMAQNAGAVGVILVNREEGVFGYNGTTDGPLTNIPFAFISKSDGETIRAMLDAGGDVVAFIGNKLGYYDDDAGMSKPTTPAPAESCTPSLTAVDATEFGFDVGTKIYNYGNNLQSNVMLTATVTGPAGTWTEMAGPFSIPSGDSVDVFTGAGGLEELPAFSFSNYPVGVYYLNYNIDLGVADEMSFDNDINYTFVVSDDKVSFAPMDTTSMMPDETFFTRSVDPAFGACQVYRNSNASRLGATGMYFTVTPAWNSGLVVEGEISEVILYKWNDIFTDVNDAGFDFSDLEEVASGEYTFGPTDDGNMVFAAYDVPVQLIDNQRYLACVNLWNDDLFLGYNNRIDYTRNIDHYLQPLTPITADGSWFWGGFGADMDPAIALGVIDADELGINEASEKLIQLYPNPAKDQLTIELADFDYAQSANWGIEIRDMTGRLVTTTSLVGSSGTLDVSSLEKGQYAVRVYSEGLITVERFSKL